MNRASRLAGAGVLALLTHAAPATAQADSPCGARAAVSAALALTGTNVRVSPSVVSPSPQGEARLTHGRGFWAAADAPLTSRLALRIEAARSQLPIVPPEGTTIADTGDVRRSQLLGGVVYRPGGLGRACGYLTASAGWQRLSYRDRRAAGIEIGGGAGMRVAISERLAAFFEVGLSGAHTGSAALVNAEIVFSGRFLVGVRHAF